jgi:hypothetical protein
MKYVKIIIVLVIAFLSAWSFWMVQKSDSSTDQTSPEKKIRTMLQNQLNAWNSGSTQGFMENGYWQSDSLQFVSPNGVKFGYEQVLKMYRKSYPTPVEMGTLNFEILHIKFLDEQNSLAQVLGKWHVTENPKPGSGYFSLIVKFINDEPKIIIDHTY